MPLLERCQLTPPSVLRNTPAPPVPASTIDGFAGDAASPYTVPPYTRAEVQVLTPAPAGGAGTTVTGTTVNSADSPATKISGNRRRIDDSAMSPSTTGPCPCPSQTCRSIQRHHSPTGPAVTALLTTCRREPAWPGVGGS